MRGRVPRRLGWWEELASRGAGSPSRSGILPGAIPPKRRVPQQIPYLSAARRGHGVPYGTYCLTQLAQAHNRRSLDRVDPAPLGTRIVTTVYNAVYWWAFCSFTDSPGARTYHDTVALPGHPPPRPESPRQPLGRTLHGRRNDPTPCTEHTTWGHRQVAAA